MAYNNVKVKERQTVNPTAQTQQLGVVSTVPMNEWSAAVSYEKLNIVTYKNGTFLAMRASTGIAPLEGAGWQDVWMPLLSGIGIASNAVEYASGDVSSSSPPQDGWDTALPAFQAGKLLWTRLTITYSDRTRTTFYSAGVTVAPTKTSELANDGSDGTSPFATQAGVTASLGDYYTKTETDNQISTAIENAITKALNTPV